MYPGQKRYRSPTSPPRKRAHFDDEFYQTKSAIIEIINENTELDDELRERYLSDFLRQSSKAQSPEDLHRIASPFLQSPTSPYSHAMQMSSSSSSSRPSPSPASSTPMVFLTPSQSPQVVVHDESFDDELEEGDSIFGDSPTDVNWPTSTSQKAHGVGVTRDTYSSNLVQRMFNGRDLNYLDIHNTGQDYGPGVYDRQIFPSFVSSIHEGFNVSQRVGNSVNMLRFTMHMQIILPGRTVTELSSALLNDELRVLIVKDVTPAITPRVTDVLSVHDSHHTINAFINPAHADRFAILYDTSFFMQYTTLWEFTRGGAEKEAKCLPVDIKEVIDIDLGGETCQFNPHTSGYSSLVSYNIFAVFISARGIKLTHGYLSDVEEAETFNIDWSARIVFK